MEAIDELRLLGIKEEEEVRPRKGLFRSLVDWMRCSSPRRKKESTLLVVRVGSQVPQEKDKIQREAVRLNWRLERRLGLKESIGADYDPEYWMSRVSIAKFWDLVLPASHDSATYQFKNFIPPQLKCLMQT
jgi:hypothetical protein